MKLYLSSLSIPNKAEYINLFDGKRMPKIAMITNAWGTYDKTRSKPYINAVEEQFREMDMQIDHLDLLSYVDKIEMLNDHLKNI